MQQSRGAVAEIIRWLIFFVTSSATAAAVFYGALSVIGKTEVPYPTVPLDAVYVIDKEFIGAKRWLSAPYKIVLLGDSLTQGDTLRYLSLVPNAIAEYVHGHVAPEAQIKLAGITYSGLSTYSYYFMVDRVLALHPNLVIVEFNLFDFSRWWQEHDRVDLADWMAESRWPEAARLPLEAVGISADRLIFGRLVEHTGLFPARYRLQREQARLASAYWVLSDWIQHEIVGAERLEFPVANKLRFIARNQMRDKPRATRRYARLLMGNALSGVPRDHPALVMLGAVLAPLHSAGVDSIVYVPPYNVEHLVRLGLLDVDRLATTIANTRAMAERYGATFVDLHDSLPDNAFRDGMDHLVVEGPDSRVGEIGKRIGEAVAEVHARRTGRTN